MFARCGSLLPDLESANKLGKPLVKVLGDNNCPCSYIPVSTDWPNGRAIGHCFEVMEAVAIMSVTLVIFGIQILCRCRRPNS